MLYDYTVGIVLFLPSFCLPPHFPSTPSRCVHTHFSFRPRIHRNVHNSKRLNRTDCLSDASFSDAFQFKTYNYGSILTYSIIQMYANNEYITVCSLHNALAHAHMLLCRFYPKITYQNSCLLNFRLARSETKSAEWFLPLVYFCNTHKTIYLAHIGAQQFIIIVQ